MDKENEVIIACDHKHIEMVNNQPTCKDCGKVFNDVDDAMAITDGCDND